MLTEAEAKTNICCVSLRDRCVTKDCMGWRWLDHPAEIEIFVDGESDQDFAKRRDQLRAKRRGYCGMAGPIGIIS